MNQANENGGEDVRLSRTSMMFQMEEDDNHLRNFLQMTMDHSFGILNEKLKLIEKENKQVKDSIKLLKDEVKKEKSTPDGIKEKVAEIKPEMIKLWAKCDTL